MKKVLIINNVYHSSPRIPGFAKYLPAHGWEAVLLTVPIREGPVAFGGPPKDIRQTVKVVETLHYRRSKARVEDVVKITSKSIRKTSLLVSVVAKKMYGLYNEIFFFPDSERKWIPYAIAKAESILKSEKVDVILSSSSPVSCHVVARALKIMHGIPWVADFRDLWTQNHDYAYSPIRRVFERNLEKKTLRHADVLITVSPPLAQKLEKLHNKRAVTITNGFDPESYDHAVKLTNNFTLTYTGQIYTDKQDPLKILFALKELIEEGRFHESDVELRYYGPESKLLNHYIIRHDAAGFIRQYGVQTIEAAHQKLTESQILVMFNWEDANQKGVYTQKIFDYLGARRPMLATGGFRKDVREELLKETNAGIYAVDVQEIKAAILAYYEQFKKSGNAKYIGNEKTSNYSYPCLSGQLARVLDSAAFAKGEGGA